MIDDFFLSLDDFKRVYRREKRKIAKAAIVGFLLCFGYFVSIPRLYEATATFQQSASRAEQIFDPRSFMRSISGGGSESSIKPVMLSRTVLGKAVEELGLQAKLDQFDFQHVHYKGEKPKKLSLRFIDQDNFEIYDATGRVGEAVHVEDVSLTLVKAPSSVKMGKIYSLTILPERSVVDHVKSRISIKPLRSEKNILAIKFSDPDPRRAAAFVNTLMSKYEEFLIEENKLIIGSQLQYLGRRQNELNEKLDVDLKDHAALLKKSLQEQGFMGVQEELQSILEPLKNYRERLDDIEVEMTGLEKRISHTTLDSTKLAYQFGYNLAQQIQETSFLLQKIETEEEKTPLRTVLDHLVSRQKNLNESSSYIDTLETDFRGMTLEAARLLFQQYCNQLDGLHAELKQVIFFRDHLHEPHFEISTLSNVLTDTVTDQLVQKSSEIETQLCDSINRSTKEHERLKEMLSIQKRFLESHLSQTIELGKIRIQLIKEKIGSLYEVMKDLLMKEKEVLTSKIVDLKLSLKEIPELWLLEKRLDFKAQLTKGMMAGITEIAESKNLSRHLYQVESKPLDTALEPLAPVPTHLLLKSLCGGMGFAFLIYLVSFFRGIPVSLTTLRLMGGHTSGTLDSLETFRCIASFVLERKQHKGVVVALLGERGFDFSPLVNLLVLHEKKCLIIDGNFDHVVEPQDQPGLWHYLNKTEIDPPFRHQEKYDFIPAGGTTPHGLELLSTECFSQLLNQCRGQYDFIFLLRQAKLNSQDALQTLNLVDLTIVTTDEESQETLKPYLHWSRHKEKSGITFAQYA